MNSKISMALFAFAAFLRFSQSIPTHRFARETQRDLSDEVIDLLVDILENESSDSDLVEEGVEDILSSTLSEVSSLAGSELHPSVVTKEGNSPTSSFQSHIPSFGSYPSQLPSQFNPSQYGQYPSQFPSQFNPSQYRPSSGSAATTSTAQGSSNATP